MRSGPLECDIAAQDAVVEIGAVERCGSVQYPFFRSIEAQFIEEVVQHAR